MPFTLTMPKLSPTMEVGAIAKWHKTEGSHVDAGELLLEVATDKATIEYNAIDEGWLRKILVLEGNDVEVNQAIAIFTAEENESIEGYQPTGIKKAKPQEQTDGQPQDAAKETTEETKTTATKQVGGALSQPVFAPEKPLENYSFAYPEESLEERIIASPVAKKLAKEQNLDLSTVKGTGPGGRIMKEDLARAQPAGSFVFGKRQRPDQIAGSFTEENLTPMRRVIAQRLQEAKTFIPHFYVQQIIDAEPLIALRDQLRALELKVSFNDLVVKATALALREHPVVNSGFNSGNQSIVRYNTIDISVAVSLPEGLITPIIRFADYKNVGQISLEIRELAQRAKKGKLEPHEYKGGSFTVSNLGMYGVTDFQAIINPPQAAILAVSGINDVPVVKNGAVVPGKQMSLNISVDHRVVDGTAAASFLGTLKRLLENPVSLVL